ncbi:MAG: hypothetical protein A3E87_06430 [Gammaproteobacteria bacterium RIFCSPHIGHO2_12_FULL_35_23]|nr:MAG: hypothetical protein A3E87_06430 [Gammaproteobacteria bacterium RIFCSPHIGHO2_12_FULL_35_23]
MDVALINMPMAAVERPSIALGILSSRLKQNNISVKSYYAMLRYLNFLGGDRFQWLDLLSARLLVGDWIFSSCIFPDNSDNEKFFDALEEKAFQICHMISEDFREVLLTIKNNNQKFIDELAVSVLADNPRIVGCTSMFSQHIASLAILKKIKELRPEIVTVIGGANCATIMGKTTHEEFKWVDVVVSGEADDVAVPLFKALLSNNIVKDFSKLPNWIFLPHHRESGYPVAKNSQDNYGYGVSYSLNKAIEPDYDDYFFELEGSPYRKNISPGLLFESSRGCWWGEKSHCTFCGLNAGGMNYRSKSAEQVFNEIKYLSNKYKCQSLQAVDNIIDMTYFKTLLPWVEGEDVKYSLFFETKSNLKKEQVEQFFRSGVRYIQPGIESLHTDVLQLMRKGANAWQNVQLLKWCRQYGIFASWNILIGFPGEKEESYEEMSQLLPLLTHFQPGSCAVVEYHRYSPYFNNPDEFNLSLIPMQLYNYMYPLDKEKMMNIGYFFEDVDKANVDYLSRKVDLYSRPAVCKLVKEHQKWAKASAEGTAKLFAKENNGIFEIEDTRECAVQNKYYLTLVEKAVVEHCDSAIPENIVVNEIYEKYGFSPQKINEAINVLLNNKILVNLDNRFLSLVLYDPIEGFLTSGLPFGELKL